MVPLRTLKSIAWSLFVVLILQFIDYHGWFAPWNARIFNWILVGSASNPDTELARNIFTVEIDDNAYNTCFHSQSPMDPARVINLVSQVAAAGPKAVGVDIRTEGAAYSRAVPDLRKLEPSIVWVSAFANVESRAPAFPVWLFGASDEVTVTPLPVLGTPVPFLPDTPQTLWGLPVYPRDNDGAVRRFPRAVNVGIPGHPKRPARTWARKVAAAYCGAHCAGESADEVYMSYAGVMPRSFKMLDLVTCRGDHDIQPGAHAWQTFQYLARNNLVLIGGTFHDSGDFYPTPVGQLPGLMINAYAVKADLSGNGYEDIKQPYGWFLDWGMALLLIALSRFLPEDRPSSELLVSTGLVIAVCTASLFVAHGRYLIGFGGEGIAVILDQAQKAWALSRRKQENPTATSVP